MNANATQQASGRIIKHSRPVSQRSRRGAAAVEFAVVAPLFFLFIFAGMEFARANTIRNLCDNTALEAARAGILPGATRQKCEAVASRSLDLLMIRNATVTVEPFNIQPTTPEISVTVSVPLADNMLPMSRYVVGSTLTRSITLKREQNQ